MRMDRYEEDDSQVKQTRTNKNQELYTDVYLNNAYVDINELKDVMNEEEEKEEVKKSTPEVMEYSYEEKNYDIKSLIEEAIKNSGDDNIKRSIQDNHEIDSIIESINENQFKREQEDNLLSELMNDNTTTMVNSLDTAITDTSMIDTSIIHKDEMSNELLDEFLNDELKKKNNSNENLNVEVTKEEIPTEELEEVEETEEIEEVEETEETEEEENNIVSDEEEMDDTFANETKVSKKVIFIVIGIIIVIGIVIGILIWKEIIKIK